MELFEQIRRDHDREGTSLRELARRYGVRRRTVHQALESAIPPPRKHPAERPAPVLGPYHELVDSWLLADQEAPRKQRHTAKRITDRLRSEHGANLSERTVREYVPARRREFDQIDAHIPQAHPPGYEAECDWGEATTSFRFPRSHPGPGWSRCSPSPAS